MKITRFQFLSLPVAATAAAVPEKPIAVLKHLGDDNDAGLIQARIELWPRHEAAVMRVEGVEFCTVTARYDAVVYKGGAFTWAELEPKIIAALKEVR